MLNLILVHPMTVYLPVVFLLTGLLSIAAGMKIDLGIGNLESIKSKIILSRS